MQNQEKQVPLYACTGEHVGTISVEKARAAATASEMNLRFKGRGRKTRVVAAYLTERKPHFSNPRATLTVGEMIANAEGSVDPLARKKPYVDHAMNKVEAWPLTFDEKNVGICAGRVINPTT